jgi:DNA repair protein RadD
MICAPENILNAICYEVGVRELIRDGYLCPLITKSSRAKADTATLHVREGEYVAGEVEELMDQAGLVSAACAEIVAATFNRQSCLIFASGVRHGKHVAKVLQEMVGKEVGFVSGETPGGERDLLLKRFRGEQPGLFDEEPLKYLVNVNVLTTGFDAPGIDCVALLRPTMSPGLFYQMVGRGFRLSPGKRDCLVLDFGNNAVRHGPVDQLCVTESAPKNGGEAPARECPECHRVVAAGYSACPECGYTFPPSDRQKHDAKPSDAAILSGQILEQVFPVVDVYYGVHTKRGADENTPRTMRVDYVLSLTRRQSEWVCFEHEGFARQKAEAWWRARSHDPVPATAAEAAALANAGALAPTRSITVRSVAGEKFDRVVDYVLDEKPPVGEHHPVADLDEIPF